MMELDETTIHEATKADIFLTVKDEDGNAINLVAPDDKLSVSAFEFPGDSSSLLFSLDTDGAVSIVDAPTGRIKVTVPETAIPQRFHRREGRIEVRTHAGGVLTAAPTRRLLGRLTILESIATL